MWPQTIDLMFWLFAFKAAAERMNNLNVNLDGSTLESIFFKMFQSKIFQLSHFTHYFVDYTVQEELVHPNWNHAHTLEFTLDTSRFMQANVALVFNPSTGHVSPKYHVDFDNYFTTVQ